MRSLAASGSGADRHPRMAARADLALQRNLRDAPRWMTPAGGRSTSSSAALSSTGTDRTDFLDDRCGATKTCARPWTACSLSKRRHGASWSSRRRIGAADPSPATLAGQQIGPYRLVRPLGHGGMGSVYLGRRSTIEQEVAIKLVRRAWWAAKSGSAFAPNARPWPNSSIPTWPASTMAAPGGRQPYLVMERIEGLPIDRYCDRHGLPLATRLEALPAGLRGALSRAPPAAGALRHQAVERAGHRDGTPKLLDFGITKLLRTEDSVEGEATRTGWRPLTPSYASPEQVLGEPITTASGCVFPRRAALRFAVRLPAASRGLGLLPRAQPDRRAGPRKAESADTASSDTDPGRSIPPMSQAPAGRRRPRELQRQLEGDLDAIVLKAVRKEPGQRYASVDNSRRTWAVISRAAPSWPAVVRGATAPPSCSAGPFGRPIGDGGEGGLLWAAALVAVLGAWRAIW